MPDEIESITVAEGMRSNNEAWYQINVRVAGKSTPITAGTQIRRRAMAEKIAREIEDALTASTGSTRDTDAEQDRPGVEKTV